MHPFINTKGVALLVLILFLIILGSSLWENAPWNKAKTYKNLNSLYRIYVDPLATLEADDLIQKPHREWHQPANKKMNFGFESETYWLKADFQATASGAFILELPYSLLKSIEVFTYLDGKKEYHYKTGINRGFKSRPIAHRNFLFPIDLRQNQEVTILMKVESDGFLDMSSRLWSQEDFYKKDQVTSLIQGAYFGTIAFVLIYNILALFILFNITQLWFVIYSGLFFTFQTSMQGFGHQFFWPETPEHQNLSISITMIAGGLISCFFAYAFLEIKRHHVKTNYLFLFFGFCMLALLLAYPFFEYTVILRLQILINVILGIVFIVIGINHWRKGHIETSIFIFAWLLLVLSVLLDGMEKTGIIDNLAELFALSDDIEILQLASIIEVILLSFALGNKISHDRKISMHTQQELLRTKSEQTQLLESSVAKRTQELQEAIKELATVNEKLNSQNNTDPLTGTFNRHFFIQYFETWVEEHNRKGTLFSLILFDVDHFKNINDQHGHLYGDHCLLTIADKMKNNLRDNHSDYLCRYGGEEFALLLPDTDSVAALEIAERLRQAIEDQPFEYENIKSRVTVSAGVATTPTGEQKDGKWLFEMCDQALYQAKEGGRNQIVVHFPD
jgi:diguanylate cyclase (GGDEF)-like protein